MSTKTLSINDIQTKLNEIQNSVTGLHVDINNNSTSIDFKTKIVNLKQDLNLILDTINGISGVNTVTESYINSLINDMTNQSLKDNYYTKSNGEVKSTELLKAEITMIIQLSNNIPYIKSKFIEKIENDTNSNDIKNAIKDADNKIDI